MSVFSAIGSAVGSMRAAYYDAAERTWARKNLSYSRQTGRDEDNAAPQHDRDTIRNDVLDLYRNDPLARGLVERFADNVVGSGITPQAKTDDPDFNHEAEDYIREVWPHPEVSERFSMPDLQRMAIRCPFVFGDMLFQLLDTGKINPIEGERIRNPSKGPLPGMIDGIQIEPGTGRAVEFYTFGRDRYGVVDTNRDPVRIKIENAIYLAAPFRPDQYRPLPEMACVASLLRDLKEIRQAFLAKVKIEGDNALVIKTGSGMANLGPRGVSVDASGRQLTEIGARKVWHLQPNEAVESPPNVTPNPQFAQFFELMIRQFGAAFGLPYEFVLQNFSQGSFSASRAALLQTYQTFTMRQRWLVDRFLNVWYVWTIRKAIAKRLIRPCPLDDYGVSQIKKVYWNMPEWEWVDPQSQQQADLMAWQIGTKSHTDLVAKRGKDSEEVLREKFRNIAIAHQIAAETNKEFGTALTWQDGIYAGIPGQVNQSNGQPPAGQKQVTE
jgi:lambda family phage portal protein